MIQDSDSGLRLRIKAQTLRNTAQNDGKSKGAVRLPLRSTMPHTR